MNTLRNYLKKQALYPPLIKTPPANELRTVVIIPSYNEPNILQTLLSLSNCKPTQFDVEIIVLINNSIEAFPEIKTQNKLDEIAIRTWAEKNNTIKRCFHVHYINDLPPKHAGAGLARKIAMDEAIHRFILASKPNGVLVSLDADATVSENYLFEIEKTFMQHPKQNAAIFKFEHPINLLLNNTDKPEPIVLYELYLRYYKQALAYTGFPYAFYTIGSCFAVSASAYAKQGGMNKRQAGEDFYFLNKIFPLGHCNELNHITVYPSARNSDRVPFGTGPALSKISNEGDFFTYKPGYFSHLKEFFSQIPQLFNATQDQLRLLYNNFPDSIQSFLSVNEFIEHVTEIIMNASTPESFENRFYRWFDAFKIIKYLNYVHASLDQKIAVKIAAKSLWNILKKDGLNEENTLSILLKYRDLDK